MMRASLEEKRAASLGLLRGLAAGADPARVAVAFTGGKDSGVALDLWRRVLAEARPEARPLAVSLDTGLKFPEVTALRDRLAAEWGVALRVVRPSPGCAVLPEHGRAACCGARKVEPLLAAVRAMGLTHLITGLRRDEHPSRAELDALEPRRDPDHTRVHPLLDWTEMDVWAHIMETRTPYCALYDQGYRSLGCMPCTAPAAEGERSGRDADKESVMDQLRALGYF